MSCDLSCAFDTKANLQNRPDFFVRVSGHGSLGFFLGQVDVLGLSEGLGAIMTVGKFGLNSLAETLNCRVAACAVSLLSTAGMGANVHLFSVGLLGPCLPPPLAELDWWLKWPPWPPRPPPRPAPTPSDGDGWHCFHEPSCGSWSCGIKWLGAWASQFTCAVSNLGVVSQT